MMNKKKKGFPLGCLFWIALLLLVVVVFLFNRKTIIEVLKSTNFLNIVKKEKTEEEQETEKPEEKQTPVTITTQPERKNPAPKGTTETNGKPSVSPDTTTPETEEKPATETVPPPQVNIRNAKLYFIDVNQEGQINLKSVMRPVAYTDSPLTDTLRALFGGLLPSELNMGLLNLIPEHTILRSVRLSGGTAYLDFNESFRFNSLGKEGHIAQIKQIVYTATEFPTVKNVQFMIEGKQEEYLGPEGVYIGKPLTRESF